MSTEITSLTPVEKRWAKVHAIEKSKILNDSHSLDRRALLLGFLAGDGSVQKRFDGRFFHYQLDFFPDDSKMLEVYLDILYLVYKKYPHVKKDSSDMFHVRLTSKVVVEDIFSFANFGLKNWTVPFDLINNCKIRASMWLQGFFSAEAYVGGSVIKVQTVNKLGMNQLSKLLNLLEIEHKSYTYLPKKVNHSKVYIISILKKSERLKFFRKVGFSHNKKELKLKETLDL